MSYLGRTGKLSQRAYNKLSFLATAGQTVKSGLSYVAGFVEVYVNGTLLTDVVDYSASNGNSVTFLVALSVDDEVTVVSLKTFVAANMLPLSGGTLNGDLDVAGSVTVDGLVVDGDASINRLSTDGVLLDLKKDGTTTGSIGTKYGTAYMAGTAGGVIAGDAGLLPGTSSGTLTDGVYDLGGSPYRFKDLKLSGGVYLGGTGAANKLDDYEEGTWTPTFNVGSWGGMTNFTYTKIGRLVHITGYLVSPSGLPSGGVLSIGGLPFRGNLNYNMAQLWYSSSITMDAAAYLSGNSYTLSVRPVSGNPSDLLELSVQMTYITDQ
jgi:hypothetical protein